ncbi:MAG: outer membrane protein transport protein [Clostridiales bacterium]|nr:outer membrane protein transport protein [Clostridiales bacterium]
MKNLFMGALVALSVILPAVTVKAEGYQVNTLSTRQIGMGHTGTGMHLGGESMFFNPAGLGFMDKHVDLSGSFTAIFAHAEAKQTDGTVNKTANDPSTPIMANAAFSVYDNLKVGVSFYTPYGSGINWTDNWPGAMLNQKVNLKVFTLQPTVAWRVTDKLSIGAGVTVNWGTVDLDKGLIEPSTADMMLKILSQTGQLANPSYYGDVIPASVNLNGKSKVAVGFNVGAMYDILDNLTVGVSYRSKVKMSVDAGKASLTYANRQAEIILSELQILNSTNFSASMPCPYVLSFGASWKPVEKLILAADARLTGWKTYRRLDIEFLDPVCAAYNQNITKDYRNCWAYSVGAEYALTPRLDLRAGLMLDTSPVNKNHYNPETPGMTKIEPTAGFSFKPVKGMSIDFSFMYVAGLGVDGASCEYADALAAKINQLMPSAGLPLVRKFTADYKVHAFIPSIGVSYAF